LNPATPSAAAGSNTHSALCLTRGIALAWVLVHAATPMFQALGWTALNKDVRPDDPLASWLAFALALLGALALPAPLLLHALVLRRAAPALRWRQIVLAMPLVWMASMAAEAAAGVAYRMTIVVMRSVFPLAEFRSDEFVGLPWRLFIGPAGALFAIGVLVLAWLFARVTHVRRWVPLVAMIGATMAVALLWGLWALAGVNVDLLSSAMNGWTWGRRASALLAQTLAHAIWAAVALLIFAQAVGVPHGPLLQTSQQRLRLGAAALVGALLVPGIVAALAPGGGQWLKLAAQRALSPAPAQDSSEGEPLLQYAFSAPVRVREIPRKASVSPDGRWIIAVASDHQVIIVDAATGNLVHRFPDVLRMHESPDWAWSPDARWLALRTRGDTVVVGKSVRHQVRLRLYAVPGFAPAGEYRHTGTHCLAESHTENAVLFGRDGAAVWLACEPIFQPTAADLLALRLDVPLLQVQAERRYGDLAPWRLRGLKEVGESVWSWHTDHRPPYAHFRDLGRDRVPVALQSPPEEPFPRPKWTLQEFSFDESRGVARFNAWSEHRQGQLAYDMRTGAMVSQTEDPLPPDGAAYSLASTANSLRIERRAHPASRAGELIAVDAASGLVRQRIRTAAQYPLSFSADGRLLVTHADGELRVYRIQRAAASPGNAE
jgi:hypothetical protein